MQFHNNAYMNIVIMKTCKIRKGLVRVSTKRIIEVECRRIYELQDLNNYARM